MKEKARLREKKRLDNVADCYKPQKERFENIRLNYLAKTIMPKVKGPAVLEMGCSAGIMTKILADTFSEVSVVDGSEKYIECAKKMVKKNSVKFFHSLFEDFTPEEKFNDIIMSHILEHIESPVLILKKAKKWLSAGGRIHIAVPNASSLHRIAGQKMGVIKKLNDLSENDKRVGHRRVYIKDSLEKDIKKAGLKAVCFEGIFLKPLSSSQMDGWSGNLLDAFFEMGKIFPEYCSVIYIICKK